MKKLFSVLAILAIALLSVGGSCSKENNAAVQPGKPNLLLLFRPVVDTAPLQLDSVSYTNYAKEKYSVNAFKFYVSGFRLINTDSGTVRPIAGDNYFLINAADSTTWTVPLVIATGFRYNKISFIIGVDSARNTAGAQTGALDPARGMFWTWNSGYVMAKLEGQSPVSSLVNNKMEYHIGGFRGEAGVLQRPLLSFPAGEFLLAVPGGKSSVTITANVNTWFDSPHPIRIADNPSCTTPGRMAKAISDNYSGMFTVTRITN